MANGGVAVDKGNAVAAPAWALSSSWDTPALNTGPWEFRLKDTTREVVLYGCYLSIWRRQADTTWKLALDIGVTVQDPDSTASGAFSGKGPQEPVKLPIRQEVPEEERAALLILDRDFSAALCTGATPSALESISDDAIFLRMNSRPIVGGEHLRLFLSQTSGELSFQQTGAVISQAADFGYVYGTYETRANNPEKGNYVRIWTRKPGGRWMVEVDLWTPIPQPPKKSTE